MSNDESSTLEEIMLMNNDIHLKKLEDGARIEKFVCDGHVLENSLIKKHKQCLALFRNQRSILDPSSVNLRVWQERLLELMQEKTEREIIWIKGTQGNEGKSWFQTYLQSLYGTSRVARFDMTSKSSDILHIMTKLSLSSIDIFLFNEQRCVVNVEYSYSILEIIKDGYAISPKFHGQTINVKTPNVVIVFANRNPVFDSLSLDRWNILEITKDGLIPRDVKNLKEEQKKPCTQMVEFYKGNSWKGNKNDVVERKLYR